MAKFSADIPQDLVKAFDNSTSEMMTREMVERAGEYVYANVRNNMRSAFKDTKSLEEGLFISKVYETPSDDGINVHIGFTGYTKSKKPVKVSTTNKKTGKKYTYMREGIPIPLIALAREYGTSRGEKKKRFMFKSFRKSEIEQIMLGVQNKYLGGD